jgi:DNA topoisomerase-1
VAGSKSQRLVIVESPAKAKIISGFLGPGYVVEASMGHVRDLPRNAADVPAKYKGESWSSLGVDVDNDFAALYIVTSDRAKQVTRLKTLLKDSDELFLATDEDREGEAIAWHLVETLKPKVPVKRMVFHEITKPAIQHAVDNSRDIDQALVEAQEARRILDRLYGYEVSPVLWKKVMPKGPDGRALSAGRVQSVATRIVVERERERMRFHSAEYWDIRAILAVNADQGAKEAELSGPRTFPATLVALDDERVATGKDFDPATGQVRPGSGVVHLRADGARGLAARLEGRPFEVTRVEEKPYRRRPYAPFITSTLQQEAGSKLRYSSAQTMRTAQRLYENGYITYMRTDSVNLAETAVAAARTQIAELYGDRFVPPQPRTYTGKVKNAQEAHEAIRPAGDVFRTPGELAKELSTEEFKLYELIWRRTIASQMTDAIGSSVSVRIRATTAAGEVCDFGATGKTITDPGFLKAYVESTDDAESADDAENRLPNLTKGQGLGADNLEAIGHNTQPPARYTEPSLVKALEELGIGRPSTYASIMQTIQDRGYVFKRGQALIPSFLAFAVVGLLEGHFPRLVDFEFTAAMENELDDIAGGDGAALDFLRAFYFGTDVATMQKVFGGGGLKRMVTENLGEIDARGINSIPLFTDDAGRDVMVRVGRYGPYLQRTVPGEPLTVSTEDGETTNNADRVGLPDGIAPDELTPEKVTELFLGGGGERKLGEHPQTGEPIVLKSGRYGPYVTTGEKNASLLKSMTPDTLTLDDALKVLTLPRVLGQDAEGIEVFAGPGRYGPYIRRGDDYRSLVDEDQIFTVTIGEALDLLAQPKTRQRRAPAPPLKELGIDPITEKPLVVKDGRFGPYVTDGDTNASLRRGQSIESFTVEQGAEMLAEKRAKGPAEPKKRTTKAVKSADSAPKKAAPAKKATAAKKAAPKKAAKKAAPSAE